jgi:hypothetical protein
MTYWDGQRRARTFVPDVRSHLAMWRRFREKTGVWPLLSITTYLLRFILMGAGVVAIVWYGNANHGWTRGQGALAALLLMVPILFLWFIVERVAWNHDLCETGVSSEKDVWGTDQFPEMESGPPDGARSS